MKIYKNPFVSRECYFVKTGKAYSGGTEPTKSKGYQVQFWDGKWIVREAQYYDYLLRDGFPIVAENNISIKSVIEQAILDAVLGLAHPTEKGGKQE